MAHNEHCVVVSISSQRSQSSLVSELGLRIIELERSNCLFSTFARQKWAPLAANSPTVVTLACTQSLTLNNYQLHAYVQAPVEDGKFSLLARAGRQVRVVKLSNQFPLVRGFLYVTDGSFFSSCSTLIVQDSHF